MQPFGQPQQPFGQPQQMGAPGGYGQPAAPPGPMSSPFGHAAAAGAPPAGGVRSNPFGGGGGVSAPPMAGPGGMAPPPGAPFGGGAAMPPPPPTAAQVAERGAAAPSPGPPPAGMSPFPGAPTSAAAAPPSFYPVQNQPGALHGAAGQTQSMQPQNSAPTAYDLAVAKDIDTFNSPPHFLRSTMAKLPNSASSKMKIGIPMGMVLQPLASTPPGAEDVASVNFGAVGTIVRCKSCRTYVNPFVRWEANGRRWSCNLCGFSQATLDSYYASLDETSRRVDRFQRPELSKGAVEYIAPGEYMVRPPQPPVFMFVIDVSYTAVVTGMLDAVVNTIKEVISGGQIPGGQRVQIGIITFDTSLHFYNLNPSLSQPQMLVVSDLEDLFLPLPDDILVNISDSESAILSLLDSLPHIFRETKINESCMGSAVKGAFMAMKHIGGKLLVFGACIPSVGELALKSTRDNPRVLGTDREVEILRPVTDGYKDLAGELTRAQISVEMFVAPQQYMDLASIAPLVKYTGGDVRYYPQFHIQHSGLKLKNELMHVITRYMGWEAVMRVRVSTGWKITKFYGHLFIRGADLLVVPNCHADQTFAITIDLDENVAPGPVMCVQAALLYTNSEGERRIRVHTWAALTTAKCNEIMNSVDVQATTAILSQSTLEHSLKTTLAEGRNKLQTQCQQIVQCQNMYPEAEALQFLPLYVMGMLKSTAFRGTNDVGVDLRTFTWLRLETLGVTQMSAYYYPRLISLHNIAEDCGNADENGSCKLPDMLNLTSESMTQDGVYLLEDGESMIIWVGRAADPGFIQTVFGAPSFEHIDSAAAEAVVGTHGDMISNKIGNIISQVRMERQVPFMQLYVVRNGEPREGKFFGSLIEDRTIGLQSTYTEFLQKMGYRPPQQAPPQQQQQPPMMGMGMTPQPHQQMR